MPIKRIEYSIIEDGLIDNLPTYLILKSTYYFGVNLVGTLYGQTGNDYDPFLSLEDAQDYLNLILETK